MNIDFGRFLAIILNADKIGYEDSFIQFNYHFSTNTPFVHFVVSSYTPDIEWYKEVVTHFDQIAQEELEISQIRRQATRCD